MDKIGYFSQSDLGRLGGGCVIDRLPTAFVADKINDGDELEIDAATGVIRDLTNGAEITCPPLPASMSRILDKGGLVNYVKERIA